jgi:hypothetical protein
MLIGNIDAFERGRLFGWAFNPEAAAEHLAIRVRSGNELVAEGIANLARPDLPDAGVGAGDHAFELTLPPMVKSLEGLLVTAHSARHGELVLSALPKDDHHLNAILQIYTARYNSALAGFKTRLDAASGDIEELKRKALNAEMAPPDDLESRLQELEKRIDGIEVFLVRIDETLRELGELLPKHRGWGLSRIFSRGNG